MINQTFENFMKDVYNMKSLVRYQTAVRVKSESVAEHSYFVTVLVLKLHDYFEFNLEKALRIALLHDYPEIYISDVPSPVKSRFPKIREAMDEAESEVVREKLGEEYVSLLQEFNDKSSPEGLICAYADICSCVQYSSLEVSLGNKDYMAYVLTYSGQKLKELEGQLALISRDPLERNSATGTQHE